MQLKRNSFWNKNFHFPESLSTTIKLTTIIYLVLSLLLGIFFAVNFSILENEGGFSFIKKLIIILAHTAFPLAWLFPVFLFSNIGLSVFIPAKNNDKKKKIVFIARRAVLATAVSLGLGAFLILTSIAMMPVLWFLFVN